MTRTLLVADLFCGAGGTSTGLARALAALGLGLELVCVNHWNVAVASHAINHPAARHYCQDLATVRPSHVVTEGYLDLLTASPSCTHHSIARGGKPTSDQQRSDPWHVITWLTELRVRCLIIENVWEFRDWGPVDPATGKPIKERKGEYFRAWINVIRSLGYQVEWRRLNAADYGEATTRRRFILMARNDGHPIVWPEATHARRDRVTAGLQSWRPAREIIDWSLRGKSIFNRPKPLAAKSLRRIYDGIVRERWPEPFIVVLRNHMSAQGIDVPLPTIAAQGGHIALAQPVLMNRHGKGYGASRAHAIDDPMPTITCDGGGYLAVPFILSQASGGAPRAVSDPAPTITTDGAHALIAPYYGSGSGETCLSDSEPLPTVTSQGRFGLVVPITHSDTANRARAVDTDPLPTITTANRGELAFIAAAFGERPGQAARIHDLDDPAPTICATGRVNLVEGEQGDAVDILYRMLQPHELAAAMGFDDCDEPYEFAGTKTEQIRQIGNAVPVRLMRACVLAMFSGEAEPQMLEAAE
ncbi:MULTISPECIES: DNA cytosine methyltransferase [unclassified Bradyrhizobium]|uniref:DNA cytosine methyltransferase n=1 Tax=unclassified Bradyrhizobium TaxID=2631580 RepID=UPI0028EBB3E4|nr:MULTISPECIES: DNA cytosine methyltransferase [unclassified Bradyrhizobium]